MPPEIRCDLHDVVEVSAELLGENGVATEKIRHANVVSFTCLKALALDQRGERKDAYDLVYCLEHASGSLEDKAAAFTRELEGQHAGVVTRCLDILRTRFLGDERVEGYLKDGPVAVARFETGDATNPEARERRALRQRQVADLIERFIKLTGG